jgi:DNA polymerase-1
LANSFFNLANSKSLRKKDLELAKKSKKSKVSTSTITYRGNGSLTDKIQSIVSLVNAKFANKKDSFILIRDEQSLIEYIDKCVENKVISIDTETTGLDPVVNHVVGVCIYTPGKKAAYIPVNHISYITQLKVENQLSVEFIREQLQRIKDNDVKTYWFNAPFDIRFIYHTFGIMLPIYWDAYIASWILNSKEGKGNRKLKNLHKKYCRNNQGEAFSFDKLFEGIPFDLIPINTAYLYAANDAIITYELAMYQAQYLDLESPLNKELHLEGLSNVFFNIEMASMPAFIEMEENGVVIDTEYAKGISEKYHKYLDKAEKRAYSVLAKYSNEIEDYRRRTPGCKLSDPVNLQSPTQLAILFYDVFKFPTVDKKKPRGTDAEILEKFDHPLAYAVLDIKFFNKQISTYVDKIPQIIHSDGRIRCKFNQHGAETGRVSSDSPNLQNIPSRPKKLSNGETIDAGHDIRQFFVADKGKVLLSCDYSGQEVRVTAHMAHDRKMIKAYQDGKDVYVEIASLAYNVPYEDCLENFPDGTTNPEGKARRGSAKSIVLGILYGRQVASIAEQLNTTTKEAQVIFDKVLASFPDLHQFIKESVEMARKNGWVQTHWGRRRQLPDMLLLPYEFNFADDIKPDFDPLSEDDDEDIRVPQNVVDTYTKKLQNCRGYRDKQKILDTLKSQGILVTDNTRKINDAERQCVNSRVQGSAADLTKLAMIELYNCQELRDLGFKMLIPVHDEIIAECPVENSARCAELMSTLMLKAGKDLCVPLKCDTDAFYRWYGEKLDPVTLEPLKK